MDENSLTTEPEKKNESSKEKWRGELKLRVIDNDFRGIEKLAKELELELDAMVKGSKEGYNKELSWGQLRPIAVISNGKVVALNLPSLKLRAIPVAIKHFKFLKSLNKYKMLKFIKVITMYEDHALLKTEWINRKSD